MTFARNFDRVILGTVQLGVPYGRTAAAGLMPESDAFALLDAAWALGIRRFDTAEAYGVSAVRLARWLERTGHMKRARVVTKVGLTGSPAEIAAGAAAALSRFEGVAELTLLSHGAAAGVEWDEIERAAKERECRLGQSVYNAADVAAAWAKPSVTTVQAPANVFDRRAIFQPSGADQEMHFRSVYLQGVLLDDSETAERRAAGAGRLAEAVRMAASSVSVAPAPLLIAMVLRASRRVDRVVLGADTAAELDSVAVALDVDAATVDEFTRQVDAQPSPDSRLLDPRTWVPVP